MKFPFDFYWRKKFGIKFGSQEHLATNFIFQVAELKELDYITKREKSKEEEFTDEEIKNIMENVDLSAFDDK